MLACKSVICHTYCFLFFNLFFSFPLFSCFLYITDCFIITFIYFLSCLTSCISVSFIHVINDNPLQYSCLGNPMDREAWQVTTHGLQELDISMNTSLTYDNLASNNILPLHPSIMLFLSYILLLCIHL